MASASALVALLGNGAAQSTRQPGRFWQTAPVVGRSVLDAAVVAHYGELAVHVLEHPAATRLVLGRAGWNGAVVAVRVAPLVLAAQADPKEAEAQAALVRVKEDYKRGAITAEQWQQLEAELAEEATASRNRADQLRARASELDAEAESVDVETQLVARLATIMRTAAGSPP